MRTFKRKSQIIVVVGLFVIMMLGQAAFAAGGFISGKVTKSDGKTPITGVQVMAFELVTGDQKRHVDMTNTNSKGAYIIGNLPSGDYRVVAHRPGYINSEKSNVSVAKNKVTGNINFILIEGATISGKVTEQDGVTPVPGVTVSIDGSDKLPKAATETDVEGKYEIRWISPDKYWIRAQKDNYVMEVTLPTPISEGQKITDLDFYLEKASTISGKIMIKNTEVPVENAAIFIGSKERLYDYVVTDAAGDYSLKGLPSGPCDIAIRAIDYKILSSEMDIPSGTGITNQNFYLEPIE